MHALSNLKSSINWVAVRNLGLGFWEACIYIICRKERNEGKSKIRGSN